MQSAVSWPYHVNNALLPAGEPSQAVGYGEDGHEDCCGGAAAERFHLSQACKALSEPMDQHFIMIR